MEKELDKLFSGREIEKGFLEKRIIFLWGQVDDETSEKIVKSLIYLDMNKVSDIQLFINSPGGSVTAGLAIYDTMHNIKSDVSTICTGLGASMGALLLTAGTKGKRFAWPHSRMMIHQPIISGQVFAPASDIKIHAEEILKTKETLNEILAEHTGQPLEKIQKDTDRDFFMNAQEATQYGLIDKMINTITY